MVTAIEMLRDVSKARYQSNLIAPKFVPIQEQVLGVGKTFLEAETYSDAVLANQFNIENNPGIKDWFAPIIGYVASPYVNEDIMSDDELRNAVLKTEPLRVKVLGEKIFSVSFTQPWYLNLVKKYATTDPKFHKLLNAVTQTSIYAILKEDGEIQLRVSQRSANSAISAFKD